MCRLVGCLCDNVWPESRTSDRTEKRGDGGCDGDGLNYLGGFKGMTFVPGLHPELKSQFYHRPGG